MLGGVLCFDNGSGILLGANKKFIMILWLYGLEVHTECSLVVVLLLKIKCNKSLIQEASLLLRC